MPPHLCHYTPVQAASAKKENEDKRGLQPEHQGTHTNEAFSNPWVATVLYQLDASRSRFNGLPTPACCNTTVSKYSCSDHATRHRSDVDFRVDANKAKDSEWPARVGRPFTFSRTTEGLEHARKVLALPVVKAFTIAGMPGTSAPTAPPTAPSAPATSTTAALAPATGQLMGYRPAISAEFISKLKAQAVRLELSIADLGEKIKEDEEHVVGTVSLPAATSLACRTSSAWPMPSTCHSRS